MSQKFLFILFCLFAFNFGNAAELSVECRDGNGDGLWSTVLVNESGNEQTVLTYAVGNRRRCRRVAKRIKANSRGEYAACRDGNGDGQWSLVLISQNGSEGTILQQDIGEKNKCVRRMAKLIGPLDDRYLVCRDGNGDGLWSTVLVDVNGSEGHILNYAVGDKNGCSRLVAKYPRPEPSGFVVCRDGNGDGLWSVAIVDDSDQEVEVLEYSVGSKAECLEKVVTEY